MESVFFTCKSPRHDEYGEHLKNNLMLTELVNLKLSITYQELNITKKVIYCLAITE